MKRDVTSFAKFSLWTGIGMIAFLAATSFIAKRFSSGPVAPVGAAASWLNRESTGR